MDVNQFKSRCLDIRKDVMEMVRHGQRGHIAPAFSIVEMLVVLYEHVMKLRPEDPQWPDRDRFILSKGHGCMSLYAVLARNGFFSRDHYRTFCAPGGILGGHPEEKVPGVEAPTGSLGHGLAIAVGFALNARLDGRSYRSFVVLGDGECNEGSVWEAALAANKHGLDNLVVLVDYNKYMSFGPTAEVCDMEPFAQKWQAFGFATREVDMVVEPEALADLLQSLPIEPGKPTAVICHTIKGRGAPFMENNLAWHHKSKIGEDEIDSIVAALERHHA